ncbi:hypothetical protein MTO96_044472, partial [Rhipicephalus appendiculatus]
PDRFCRPERQPPPSATRPFSSRSLQPRQRLRTVANATVIETAQVTTSDAWTPDYFGSSQSTVYYAFAIVSAFYLFLVISMTLIYCIDKSDFRRQAPRAAQRDERAGTVSRADVVRYSRISLALLSV